MVATPERPANLAFPFRFVTDERGAYRDTAARCLNYAKSVLGLPGWESKVFRTLLTKEGRKTKAIILMLLQDADDDDELLVWVPFIHQFKEAVRSCFVEGIDWSFYRDVICFIDGTRRHSCRPCQRPKDTARGLDTQKKSYNGHKKKHVFGIQSVTALNGMIIALGKPFRGRRHDSHALTKSRLKPYVL